MLRLAAAVGGVALAAGQAEEGGRPRSRPRPQPAQRARRPPPRRAAPRLPFRRRCELCNERLTCWRLQTVPLECKTYEVESYTGCTADGSANHCQTKLTAAGVTGYTLEGDDSLCRSESPAACSPALLQLAPPPPPAPPLSPAGVSARAATAEETSCGENPRPANLTACEAKYPIAISANETDPTDITLTPKTWAFYTITVDAATSMRHAQYSVRGDRPAAAAAEPAT